MKVYIVNYYKDVELGKYGPVYDPNELKEIIEYELSKGNNNPCKIAYFGTRNLALEYCWKDYDIRMEYNNIMGILFASFVMLEEVRIDSECPDVKKFLEEKEYEVISSEYIVKI